VVCRLTRTLHPFWGNFRVGGYPTGIQTRQSGRERYSCYTSFARLAVRARLGGGSRSLGLDEFSSGN